MPRTADSPTQANHHHLRTYRCCCRFCCCCCCCCCWCCCFCCSCCCCSCCCCCCWCCCLCYWAACRFLYIHIYIYIYSSNCPICIWFPFLIVACWRHHRTTCLGTKQVSTTRPNLSHARLEAFIGRRRCWVRSVPGTKKNRATRRIFYVQKNNNRRGGIADQTI